MRLANPLTWLGVPLWSYLRLLLRSVSPAAATCSVGAAQACLVAAKDHVKVRKQFGRPLAHNQVLSESGLGIWTRTFPTGL